MNEIQELRIALMESLLFQGLYAIQLNQHDGEKRKVFHSLDEWIAYLRVADVLPPQRIEPTERIEVGK